MRKTKTMDVLFGIINWLLYLQATLQSSFLQQESDVDHHKLINFNDLNSSIVFAEKLTDHLKTLETNLNWADIHVKLGTPSHGQLIESYPEEEALKQSRGTLISIKAVTQLLHRHCLSHGIHTNNCIKFLSLHKLHSTPLGNACPYKHCTQEEVDSIYRSIDGSCNSVVNGLYGMSFTEYRRLLPPEYFDGIQELRRSVDTKYDLPSPRLISTTFNKQRDRKENITMAFMQWTQFLEHDLSSTAFSKTVFDDRTIECCRQDGSTLSPRYIHPLCAAISVPVNDTFYSEHSVTCMPYVRSIGAMNIDCKFSPLNQLNQATHFLDGSQIYGSHISKTNKLREFRNGLLRTSKKDLKQFLPKSSDPTVNCQYDNEDRSCYLGGDSRVNLHPHLTVMHTLWVREHNRIAKELKIMNPNWNDEKLFQETRRIVIAMLQHITYNEYLPILIGDYVKDVHSLETSQLVDPRISNSFATVAFKFANSLLDNHIHLYNDKHKIEDTLRLPNYFNKPDILEEPGYFDKLVRGLASQQAQFLDTDFVNSVSNQLYQSGKYGLDIFSLNIQRSRDHGIPSYVQFRKHFGFPTISSFSDLKDVMPETKINDLKSVYRNVHDIDLLVGGLAETPQKNSLLGPTLSNIIVEQMARLKVTDRFYFSNKRNPHKFTPAQLNEIMQVTLARVFCDNGDEIDYIQPQVFKPISETNTLVSCWSKDMPFINLKLWSENSNNV